jgi:integrase
MTKATHPLSKAAFDRLLTRPSCRKGDGNNLFVVKKRTRASGKPGAQYLALIYAFGGRQRELSLGAATWANLQAQRPRAAEARKLLDQKPRIDPACLWKAAKTPSAMIYDRAHRERMEAFGGQWTAKHRAQIAATHANYCGTLHAKSYDEVTTDDVLAVVGSLWARVPETARRVLERIDTTLCYAAVRDGKRDYQSPARWKNHIEFLLPSPKAAGKLVENVMVPRGNHTALPYAEVPAFMARLRQDESIASLALEFLVLTATRADEVRSMTWDEVDLDAALWTQKAARIKTGRKSGRDHVVPLSGPTIAILRKMAEIRSSAFVFPGVVRDQPIGEMGMHVALRRLVGKTEGTVHGFRSSFRSWALDRTNFSHEICEFALNHVVGSEAAQAYLRTSALERRRELMTMWGAFVDGAPVDANVVAFEARARA